MRRALLALCLAIAALLAIAVNPGARGSTNARSGEFFKVSFQGSSSLHAFDHVDPALAYSRESWALLDTVCARLMRYRDRPPPQGYQLVPEVAASPPTLSADGRTWTFSLRPGFRFSNGQFVRANAFAQAIHRTMAPGVDSPAYAYTRAIVGAEDVHAGRAVHAAGVTARDNTLVVRFTRQVREFAAWTTMPSFCAVPPTLPPDAEGVRGFPGAGPYFIREYRPDERIVIRRNPYYGGHREHHVDGFDVDLSANSPQEVINRIEAGKADWGYALAQAHFAPGLRLIPKYGLDHSRFFVRPGLTMAMFVLNSSRPLFKDNPQLRRAVNLVLERCQFNGPAAAAVTDRLLPPPEAAPKPGRQSCSFEPDLTRARALAAGNLRDGKASLYVPDCPGTIACAQFVRGELEKIGLDVAIRPFGEFATASAYLGRLGNTDEPWDMALVLWTPDFIDPYGYINRLLDGLAAGGTDVAQFDEGNYRDRMREAASLQGAARSQAYRALDVELARDAAPIVPLYLVNEATLVSARVARDCMLLRPGLVLTTVCLKGKTR